MNNIILLPQAQRVNNIEDAVILDDFKAKNHFIESNTQEVTFEHLKNDCITPVFAKDNELTINHADFIDRGCNQNFLPWSKGWNSKHSSFPRNQRQNTGSCEKAC